MKNPFHAFWKPVAPENSVEGLPIASAALTAEPAAGPEIGEQTEMLTRARRRNRVGPLVPANARAAGRLELS